MDECVAGEGLCKIGKYGERNSLNQRGQ